MTDAEEVLIAQNAQIIGYLQLIHEELNWGEDLSLGRKLLDRLSELESRLVAIERSIDATHSTLMSIVLAMP